MAAILLARSRSAILYSPEKTLMPFKTSKGVNKANDGKRNTCGSEGHESRDCPSTLPLSEATCLGCHGEGHYKNVCPTANPHFKGGKGGGGGGWKGGGKTKGGKGQGGKGKGKGKGGKGLYELDLMNQWSGS